MTPTCDTRRRKSTAFTAYFMVRRTAMEPAITMNDEMMRCLREPFPEKEVQIKPGQGGLKYISHGSVTNRLLKCDPLYNYEILETHLTPDGKGCLGVTMALTIGGITRTEVGGPQRLG